MSRNQIDDVMELSVRLRAIGEWQQDQVCATTSTSKTLIEASDWLEKLSRHMCGQGYIRCRGGANCDSDHR